MAGMVGLVGQCGKEWFYEEFGIASETYTDVYACLSFKDGSALSLENGMYIAHAESRRDAEYVSFRPFLSDSDRKNRKIRQHPKYFTFQPFPRRIIGKKVISLRNHSKH